MRKGNLKLIFFVFIVLVLNALIFFWGRSRSDHESKLQYGQIIADLSVQDIYGDTVEIKGNDNEWKLVYLSSLFDKEDKRNTRFLEIVNQRFNESNLKVIGIFKNINRPIQYFENFSYKIINYDDNPVLKKSLMLSDRNNFILFLDPSNQVKFVSSYFYPNDIRQLAEKFLKGEVTYFEMDESQSLALNKAFPPVQVKDLKSNNVTDFPGHKPIVVLIFTGKCPNCILLKFTETYPLLEEMLLKLKKQAAYIFSAKFLEEDIRENIAHSRFDLLLAIDNIPLVEDSYHSTFYNDEEVIVLNINKDGLITYIDSLEAFIKKTRTEHND